MTIATVRRSTSRTLLGLSVFNALSAVGGGIGMVVADGLSMPKSLLADSPFDSYLVPGLVLAGVIGGTQVASAFLLLRRRESALLWSAVAGFGLLVWILTEIAAIHVFSWAQLVYVVSGLLQLALVMGLLGVASWMPREEPRADEQRDPAASLPVS